jgi:hypothetical protein
VCVCLCIPLIVARQRLGKYEFTVNYRQCREEEDDAKQEEEEDGSEGSLRVH